MENYVEYKPSKVKARIKSNLVPQIFTCQPDKLQQSKTRLTSVRRVQKR